MLRNFSQQISRCHNARLGQLTGPPLLACLGLALACAETERDGTSDTSAGSGGSSAGGSSGGQETLTGEGMVTSTGSTTTPDGSPAYLKASNSDPGDLFGVSLALSPAGNFLAVGANREASSAANLPLDNSLPDAGAVYLFARGSTGWQEQAYLKASNAGEGDAFGTSLALSADGSTLAVGAPYEASSATGVDGAEDDDDAPDAGAVYVFVRDTDVWHQQAYLKGSNTDADDRFGTSLALSRDGNTLAVGAEGEDGPATGIDGDQTDKSAYEAGAVYLFRRDGTAWEQTSYIKASNTEAWDHFGSSVTLSADGNTLAVGAHSEDSASSGVDGDGSNNSVNSAGAVYLFAYDGTSWAEQAYLKPTQADAYAYDSFGSVVSLSADGARLAVGAPGDANATTGVDGAPGSTSLPYAGAVYVFDHDGTSWSEAAYLKASNTDEGDEFGHHVALSEDGSKLAVGAALEASAESGVNGNEADNSAPEAGATYLLGSVGSFRQLVYIKAPNADAGDRFGWAVGLSADGNVLAVGAGREGSGVRGNPSDNSSGRSGAVYVYDEL